MRAKNEADLPEVRQCEGFIARHSGHVRSPVFVGLHHAALSS